MSFEEFEIKLCEKLDQDVYLPVKEELKGIGRTYSLGVRKEEFKGIIEEEVKKLKRRIKEIIKTWWDTEGSNLKDLKKLLKL